MIDSNPYAASSGRQRRGLTILFEALFQDVRYGVRLLRKSPAFTTVAVLTLALGIGANTALFSLLNALVLRDLPVPHPEQLVRFGVHAPGDPYTALSLPIFEELSRDQRAFSGTFAWWGDAVLNVEANGSLSRSDVWAVDGRFFPELGAVPQIGRLFGPDDVDLKAAAPPQLAVLGYGFWQRHFGAAPDVVGKTMKIEGLPFTILGVTRKGFTGISADDPPEVMVPLNAEPLLVGDADVQKRLARGNALWIEAAGRLKQGATLGQARAQLETLWPPIQRAFLPADRDAPARAQFASLRMKVEPGARGSSFLRGRFEKPLDVVIGIAGVLLLLACVNIAGLMLARAASRSREMGLRVALGATPGQLYRQMLAESLTLSLVGAAAGFLLAYWGSRVLASYILRQAYTIPAQLNLSPDTHLLAFTAAAAIITGLLVGLAPAWQAAREDPNAALQQSARVCAGGAGRLGRSLIVIQVALSMVLLAAAGLFARSIRRLHAAQPGFRTSGLVAVGLFPRPGGYKSLAGVAYYRELVKRVSKLAGVESAGMVHMTPGNSFEWTERARISGTNSEGIATDFVMIMPESFDPLGIKLLQGRNFTWRDDEHAPRVAIVSKNLAERLFPEANAIGRHLDVTTQPKWRNLEIAGIVSNASYYDLRKHQPLTLYVPTTQYPDAMGYSDLLLRTKAAPVALAEAVGQAVGSLGHEYVFSVKTIRQLIDKTFLRERLTAMLASFFGALALLLAAIGLYGQMAYGVSRRTREMGIRMALGARQGAVQQLIVREAFALAAYGVMIGLAGALLACRLLASLLFGISSGDPATLAMATVVLFAASALAAYFPARRATRADPVAALRSE